MGYTAGVSLTALGAVEIARRFRTGEVSAEEIVGAHVRRIEDVDGRLNAVVVRRFGEALEEARRADAARSADRARPTGPSWHGCAAPARSSSARRTSYSF